MALEVAQLPRENESDPESSRLNFRAIAKTFRSLISFAPVPISVTSGTTTLTTRGGTIFADCTAGAVTLNPPTASAANIGDEFTAFKKDTSANTLTFNGNVLGGNSGQSKITLVSDGSAWRVKLLYDEGTYTATLTGCATSPTGAVKYTRNGKSVTMIVPNFTAISNTSSAGFSGVPSFLQPITSQQISVIDVSDNGNNYAGYINAAPSGTFSFAIKTTLTNAGSYTFTNSGTKGLSATNTVSYTLQ